MLKLAILSGAVVLTVGAGAGAFALSRKAAAETDAAQERACVNLVQVQIEEGEQDIRARFEKLYGVGNAEGAVEASRGPKTMALAEQKLKECAVSLVKLHKLNPEVHDWAVKCLAEGKDTQALVACNVEAGKKLQSNP